MNLGFLAYSAEIDLSYSHPPNFQALNTILLF